MTINDVSYSVTTEIIAVITVSVIVKADTPPFRAFSCRVRVLFSCLGLRFSLSLVLALVSLFLLFFFLVFFALSLPSILPSLPFVSPSSLLSQPTHLLILSNFIFLFFRSFSCSNCFISYLPFIHVFLAFSSPPPFPFPFPQTSTSFLLQLVPTMNFDCCDIPQEPLKRKRNSNFSGGTRNGSHRGKDPSRFPVQRNWVE